MPSKHLHIANRTAKTLDSEVDILLGSALNSKVSAAQFVICMCVDCILPETRLLHRHAFLTASRRGQLMAFCRSWRHVCSRRVSAPPSAVLPRSRRFRSLGPARWTRGLEQTALPKGVHYQNSGKLGFPLGIIR